MKRYRKANGILALSLIFFLILCILSLAGSFKEEKWFSILYFLVQSCFIGCVADFIAVEALFRRRFYLPYRPVIPANRERIIRSMKDVNNTLLSRENMVKWIESFSVIDGAFQWLSGKEGRQEEIERSFAEKGAFLLVDFVEKHRAEAGKLARKEAGNQISSFARYGKEQLLKEMNREEWLDCLLLAVEEKLSREETKRQIADFMEERGDREEKGFWGSIGYWLGRKTGAIDYEALADASVEALAEEIRIWREKDHPFRRQLLYRWSRMVHAFLEDERTEKGISAFGTRLFEAFPVEEKIDDAEESFLDAWGRKDRFHSHLVPRLQDMIHRGMLSLQRNETFKAGADDFARSLLTEFISYEHSFLSSVILKVLRGFSDEELNEFVESKVHQELEGIRINGALVGLLGGCIFYLFLTFLWTPLIKGIL